MISTLPSDLESFVESQVKSGRFSSTDEVIAASVRLFQELADPALEASVEDIEALLRELSKGDDDIRNGRVRRINSEAESRAYADEIIARGRARMTAERRTP